MDAEGLAVVLLCSMIGRANDPSVRPLAAKEWSELERKIALSDLDGLAALFGLSALDLARGLEVDRNLAARIAALLARENELLIELERLREKDIGVVTKFDRDYPSRLRNSLKHLAPPVLFTAGRRGLLARGGIAVVGSRNIDDSGQAFATEIGRKCALISAPLISGGARGTDAMAMQSAIESGGAAVGVLADSLERAVRGADLREPLENGKLTLITPYSPAARFTVGAAMGRNKLIYALADYAVVVSSEVETGGSWQGAAGALKTKWPPLFVRTCDDTPPGNLRLLEKGALPLPESELERIDDIAAWMKERSEELSGRPEGTKASKTGEQGSLFD